MTSVEKRLGDEAPTLAAARDAVAEGVAGALGYPSWVREEAPEVRRTLTEEPGTIVPGSHAA
jgi:hypothetical protein